MHFTTFLMKRKLESSKLFIFHFRFKYKIDLLVKAQQLSNSIFTIFKGYQESRNQLFSRVATTRLFCAIISASL